MKNIQDSQIYVDLLQLLRPGTKTALSTVQLLDLLISKDFITVRDFLPIGDSVYARQTFYSIIQGFLKLELIEKLPPIPKPDGYSSWGAARRRRWNGENERAGRYKLTLETTMESINKKINELEDLQQRLLKLTL